jgi:hypothetical protein
MGRPLCLAPDAPARLLGHRVAACEEGDALSEDAHYFIQLTRLADNAPLYASSEGEQAGRDLGEHEMAKAAALIRPALAGG